MESLANTALALITAYGLNVLGGIAILVIGWIVASWVGRTLRRVFARWKRMDSMLASFLATVARYAILIFTLIAVMNQFGIQTTSLIAVLGAAGLAIGLAIQGTLAHLAGGVMLLLFRPFRVGHTIAVGGITGRVDEVELFTTTIISPDGVKIIVPNGKIWGDTIQNFTESRTRRFELSFAIDHRSSLEKALISALDVAKSDTRILTSPAPEAVADALTPDGVTIVLRGWAAADDLGRTRSDTAKALKQRFARDGIAIAFPQRVMQMVGNAVEPAPDARREAPKSA